MNKHFVTYEIALKLKELGFDEECIASYCLFKDKENPELGYAEELYGLVDNQRYNSNTNTIFEGEISAPLWQQAIEWFVNKHLIFVTFEIHIIGGWKIHKTDKTNPISIDTSISYYQGREEALLKAIELCKKN